MIAGTDFALTELELLRRAEATANACCRVYHSLANQTFHPKMYLLDQGGRQVAYVGSSNFTAGGLRGNVEANVRLEAPTGAPELARATAYFRDLFDGEKWARPSPSEGTKRPNWWPAYASAMGSNSGGMRLPRTPAPCRLRPGPRAATRGRGRSIGAAAARARAWVATRS
jgi:phosphatidylserine/phosphatidylglycerophosphate/cardiolipin synthase-like enzyme